MTKISTKCSKCGSEDFVYDSVGHPVYCKDCGANAGPVDEKAVFAGKANSIKASQSKFPGAKVCQRCTRVAWKITPNKKSIAYCGHCGTNWKGTDEEAAATIAAMSEKVAFLKPNSKAVPVEKIRDQIKSVNDVVDTTGIEDPTVAAEFMAKQNAAKTAALEALRRAEEQEADQILRKKAEESEKADLEKARKEVKANKEQVERDRVAKMKEINQEVRAKGRGKGKGGK